MSFIEILNVTNFLTVCSLCLCFCFLLKYLWNKRRLYFYAAKIPGPLSLPLIGSSYKLIGGTQNIIENGVRLVEQYKPLFKFWLGPKFCVVVTQPQDIEIILTNCLEKPEHYDYLTPIFGNGLLTMPGNEWKRHRRIIGSTFNQQILNSFVDIFGDYSNILVERLKGTLGKGCVDMFPILTQCTLDIVCDTTMGTKVNAMKKGSQYILWTSRASELGIMRLFNIFLHPNFIWKMSSNYKETQSISQKVQDYVRQIIERKKCERGQRAGFDEAPKKKIFLDYLLDLTDQDDKWRDEESVEEARTIVVAGSDATALSVCYVLMMLAIHQEIQNKVYEEIVSIFEDDRSPTPEDLQKMCYLERVIKETLRLFPVGGLIARRLTRDIVLRNYVLPKETCVCVPIFCLHRDSDLWSDPLTFDPDRFLPEEVSKRHPYAYLPFSGGSRNCIGFRYAMMAMKTILSTVLRHYRVAATTYTSLSDIELKFDVATKCVRGQPVQLEIRL
ncbi:cytochrome P450 4C1-like [Tenebrio molitor]|uniref:cytochrome P450 4C1-like n=1 Tax=Tenebrio molitor TaxID=7067 RepID=UPI001C3B8D12|nr:unnamed protein product [Tenebrio molitor]